MEIIKVIRRIQLLIILSILSGPLMAQTDTVIFKNHENIIDGEFKSMDRGVLTFETPYSDKDFKIEWEGIRQIFINRNLLISLKTGRQFYGKLRSTSDSTMSILTEQMITIQTTPDDVVYVRTVEDVFIERIDFNIDFGTSLTKANNLRQFTIGLGLGYYAAKWQTTGSFSMLRSRQDSIENIQRIDGKYNLIYYLPINYYLIFSANFLSNTEQKLELRTTTKLGLGKFLVRTNSKYWSVRSGLNRNLENFSNETPDRNSWEIYFGTELNIYDVGDLDIYLDAMAYPGITEIGRWRVEHSLKLKYELPFDLYFKVEYTINFDSQPAEQASRTDYVVNSAIGWEW